jgi:hypothetical protein
MPPRKVGVKDRKTGQVHYVTWRGPGLPTYEEAMELAGQSVIPEVTAPPREEPGLLSKTFGTLWGGEESVLPAVPGVTRQLLPDIPEDRGTAFDRWVYENVAQPSSSAIGLAANYLTGKAITAPLGLAGKYAAGTRLGKAALGAGSKYIAEPLAKKVINPLLEPFGRVARFGGPPVAPPSSAVMGEVVPDVPPPRPSTIIPEDPRIRRPIAALPERAETPRFFGGEGGIGEAGLSARVGPFPYVPEEIAASYPEVATGFVPKKPTPLSQFHERSLPRHYRPEPEVLTPEVSRGIPTSEYVGQPDIRYRSSLSELGGAEAEGPLFGRKPKITARKTGKLPERPPPSIVEEPISHLEFGPETTLPVIEGETIADASGLGLFSKAKRATSQVGGAGLSAGMGGGASGNVPVGGAGFTGGMGGRAAKGALDLFNQARITSLLTGLAPLKSVAGNIGVHVSAAAENRSMAPFRELFNVPAHAKEFAAGWRTRANPSQLGGSFISKFNLPGRFMGAADYAAMQSLERAGLPEAQARELLLTTPAPLGRFGKAFNENPIGKYIAPFLTTVSNQAIQGITRPGRYPGIAAGYGAAGLGTGLVTEDPEAIAVGAALSNAYGLPYLAGAGLGVGLREGTGAAKRIFSGITPIPEWSIEQALTDPLAAFTESPGERWFEPNLGFGEEAKAARKKAKKKRKLPGT